MREIVDRLHENRQIELAKSVLESNGYSVSKKVDEADTPENRYSTIRPFKKEDWYTWGGAENLPSGSEPYIWENEDYTVLIIGRPEENPPKAIVAIYPDDLFDEQITFESPEMDEDSALELGEKIAAELATGKDGRALVRQHGLKKQKY